jgi:hypothetical protein
LNGGFGFRVARLDFGMKYSGVNREEWGRVERRKKQSTVVE